MAKRTSKKAYSKANFLEDFYAKSKQEKARFIYDAMKRLRQRNIRNMNPTLEDARLFYNQAIKSTTEFRKLEGLLYAAYKTQGGLNLVVDPRDINEIIVLHKVNDKYVYRKLTSHGKNQYADYTKKIKDLNWSVETAEKYNSQLFEWHLHKDKLTPMQKQRVIREEDFFNRVKSLNEFIQDKIENLTNISLGVDIDTDPVNNRSMDEEKKRSIDKKDTLIKGAKHALWNILRKSKDMKQRFKGTEYEDMADQFKQEAELALEELNRNESTFRGSEGLAIKFIDDLGERLSTTTTKVSRQYHEMREALRKELNERLKK